MRFLKNYRLFWVCLSGLIFDGCGEKDFDPASLLSEYRMIALQSDPPEITLAQQATVRIIDHHPQDLQGDRPSFTYEWSVCPFTLGSPVQYTCFVDEVTLDSDGPEAQISPLELLMSLGDLDELQQASDQLSEEMTTFDEGKIDLYVKVKTKRKDAVIFQSVKRVALYFESMDSLGENPPLSEFKVEVEEEESSETEFKVKEELTLKINLPEEIDKDVAKTWVYSWYITEGELEKEVLFGDAEELKTTLTLPETPGPLRVYLTVRNEQGGVSVVYRDFSIVDE